MAPTNDTPEKSADPERPMDHIRRLAPGMLLLGRMIGFFKPEVKEHVRDLKTQLETFESFRAAEGDFRTRFVPLGWATHDAMSSDLMIEVVRMNAKDAQIRLTDHFIDPDHLQFLGYRFQRDHFKAWAPQYEAARSHLLRGDVLSAVPLILMVTDGIAQRWLNMSPYSGATEGEVFDTLTSEAGGLADTFKVHGARRAKKMQTDPIDVPFRNGILHGNDVAYDDPIVAAKAVNALAATLDYVDAVRSEGERIQAARDEQTLPRWTDISQTLKRTQDLREATRAWRARPTVVDTVLYDSDGEPDRFDLSAPEGAAAAYLADLVARRYGKLAPRTVNFAGYSVGKVAGQMARDMKDITLVSWSIDGVEDTASAAAWVTAKIEGEFAERLKRDEFRIRMIFQSHDNKPLTRGMDGGIWMVMPALITDLWRLGLP